MTAGHRPAGRRDPVGLRRELGLLHAARSLAGERFFPPTDRGARPLQRLGGELAVRRAAADPAALLAQPCQRPATAVDLQLLLHPRPAPAEGGGGARAEGRGRADPGAGQPHRRDAGAARGPELLRGAARGGRPDLRVPARDDARQDHRRRRRPGRSSAPPTWTSAAWSSTRRTSSASPTRSWPAPSRRAWSADFARSREVRLEEWRRRPTWQRGLEAVAKVLIEQY